MMMAAIPTTKPHTWRIRNATVLTLDAAAALAIAI